MPRIDWVEEKEATGAAAEFYRQADALEPYNAKTNYHWGLALAKLGRLPEAAERFRQVRAIDPKHAGAYQGLAGKTPDLRAGTTASDRRPSVSAASRSPKSRASLQALLAGEHDRRPWGRAEPGR